MSIFAFLQIKDVGQTIPDDLYVRNHRGSKLPGNLSGGQCEGPIPLLEPDIQRGDQHAAWALYQDYGYPSLVLWTLDADIDRD